MVLFGLVGYPLSHSWSAAWFSEKFNREGITGHHYTLFPLQNLADLPEMLQVYPDLQGFNVTIPHKISIIPFLNELDDTARDIGAVNVVKVIRNQDGIRLKGFNTDAMGFLQSLPDLLTHSKALILGSGGASKAIAWALNRRGIEYLFVSETKSGPGFIGYGQIDSQLLADYTLIINTTPVGMFPDTDCAPPLPYLHISDRHFLYDLIYNPVETCFLSRGKQQQAQTRNGLSMLENQAEASFRIFMDH